MSLKSDVWFLMSGMVVGILKTEIMLYYISVYVLQLQSTDGMSGFEVPKTAGKYCRLQISAYTLVSTWMKVSEAVSSSSTARHTVGQVSLKERLLFMGLTTRGQNKEAPNLWALSLCVCLKEQNRSLLTRGSSSCRSNKLCTSHTHRYKDEQTHT